VAGGKAQPLRKFKIFAILYGEEDAFFIELDKTEVVGALTKAIKAENSDLATFDAHKLTLYKVNLDEPNDQDFRKGLEDISQDLSKATRLSLELSMYFDEETDFQQGRIHILVKPGETMNPRACSDIAETGKCDT